MTYNDLIKVAKQDPKNWKSIMTELSNNGAPADALGSKALIYACKNNNTEMARFLIERGALPRDRNSISLKYAVYYRNRELADLLISNRARVGRCNAWLRALIKQDLFLFKLKCLDNDFSLAALILKKFSIPKEQMMDLCLEDVLKTRSIHLLSVLIYECKKLPECPPDDEWAQNTRLFDDCSICLRPKVDSSLPCGHYFHWRCIDRWRCIRKTCPLCNTPFRDRVQLDKFFIDTL